jgi:hypothetical protein
MVEPQQQENGQLDGCNEYFVSHVPLTSLQGGPGGLDPPLQGLGG